MARQFLIFLMVGWVLGLPVRAEQTVGEADSLQTMSEADSLFAEAMASLSADDLDASVKALKRVLGEDRSYAPAQEQLARLYLQMDTPSSRLLAEKAVREAMRLDGKNPIYQMLLGDVMLFRGFRYEAGRHYDRVLEKFPNSGEVAYWAGRYAAQEFMLTKDRPVYMGSEDFAAKAWDRAVLLLERSIDHNPDLRDAYYLLGVAHLEYNKPERMMQTMMRLMKRFPKDKDALLFLALGFQRQGQMARAQKLYQLAMKQMNADELAMMESVDMIASEAEKSRIELAAGSTDIGDAMQTAELKTFWKKQDPLFLTDFNERQIEHYGRVAYANLRFSVPSRGEVGWETVRGQTYIKYGHYLHRSAGVDYMFFETWFYEDFRFTFQSVNGLDKWGFAGEVGMSASPDPLKDAGVGLRDRERSAFMEGGDALEYLITRRFFRKPTSYVRIEDRYPVKFNDALFQIHDREAFEKKSARFVDPYQQQKYSLPHQLTAFREGDSVRVELAYAVPVNRLAPGEDLMVEADDGVFVFDSGWNDVYRRVIRVRRPTPDSTAGDHLFRTRVLNVPPGEYQFVAEVGDRKGGSIGTFRELRTVGVRDTGFVMSDLLVANRIRSRESFPTGRHDLDILPNPVRTFDRDRSMFVYLELYNLDRNDFGRTRYDIAYRIGVPEKDEVDPALFGAVELVAGRLIVTEAEQADVQGESVVSKDFSVRYVLSERNRLRETFEQLRRAGRQSETVVTSEYEGDQADDFTFLEIDLTGVSAGIYKLTVSAIDQTTKARTERHVLFRVR